MESILCKETITEHDVYPYGVDNSPVAPIATELRYHRIALLNMEKLTWSHLESLSLPVPVYASGRYCAGFQRRKVSTNIAERPSIYDADLPSKSVSAVVAKACFCFLRESEMV